MIYYTGDVHRNFDRIYDAYMEGFLSRGDVVVILGDAGINYYSDFRDYELKKYLSQLPLMFFCIHGNHERRPGTLVSYETKIWRTGKVYYEPAFPNLLFAIDGQIYDLNSRKTIVIGGAYSVDKFYRLSHGYEWFKDEQPSDEIKQTVENVLESLDYKIDQVLSHTCPTKFIPKEMYIAGLDQSTVDDSTELWLDKIENRLIYNRWLCGHWHTDKIVKNVYFLYNEFMI